MHLLFLLFLTVITHNLPITTEKYITYNWDLSKCYTPCSISILKNNISYLHHSFQPGNNTILYTLPWYVFPYNVADKYEWFTTRNETTITKFYNSDMDKYYATSAISSYSSNIEYRRTKYIVIEIPHFTNSLLNSCLDISIKMHSLIDLDSITSIKIFNAKYIDSYILVNYSFQYRDHEYNYKADLIIGCTYPDQIGPFDITPGKIYIMEIVSKYEFRYDIKLKISPIIHINIDDSYKTITIFLSCLLFCIFMFIVYICIKLKYCNKSTNEYELVINEG